MFWWRMEMKCRFKDFCRRLLEIPKTIFRAIGYFIMAVLTLVRNLLYGVLCVAFKLGLFAFLAGFYFAWKCYKEYSAGVPFGEMENFKTALCLFLIPIAVAILREFLRPRDLQNDNAML